jgi:hypothetical protein
VSPCHAISTSNHPFPLRYCGDRTRLGCRSRRCNRADIRNTRIPRSASRACITSAQLFVTAWGVSKKHDLRVDGNVVLLHLDATRPEFANRFEDTSGFIYVKAAGYAPIMSEAFTWPAPGAPTVIDFRSGRHLTIAHGTRKSLDVPIRRPLPRRVRLVDQDGRAVVAVKAEVAAYWRTPNHCGFMNGRDVVVSGSTDENGAIVVPDVDGPYALNLLERDLVFADADSHGPLRDWDW